jgi:serine/threonine protein kinase
LAKAANHKGIVQILNAVPYTLPNYDALFFIVMEFCSGGDLNSRLSKPSSFATKVKWISQISDALSYLHSLDPPIVHRDLKADNVMLTNSTEDLKLGDFGLAREYPAIRDFDGNFQSPHEFYMTSGVGAACWMAPEVFRQCYTEKEDVFSLGGIFYAILTRDFIQIGPKLMYGVFAGLQFPNQHYPIKVGLGYAMHTKEIYPNTNVLLPNVLLPSLEVSEPLMQLTKNMLQHHRHYRPSASLVKTCVDDIRQASFRPIAPPPVTWWAGNARFAFP